MASTTHSKQKICIAVIGMPGHGKSTFLNALVNKRNEFQVGSGGASCTQEVSKKTFQLPIDKDHEIEATVIDTMGFPDPDPEKAATHYDSVIECCNEQLNAIVWLVKCERELHSLVEQYKVLLREFNNAKPPIIMIVNGLENNEDDEERKERKERDVEQSTRFGEDIAEAAGVQVLKTIPGAEKADLKKNCQNLLISLQGIPLKSSKMKTFTQLETEIKSHMDQESTAKKEMEKRQEALDKKKQNIVDLKSHIKELKDKQRSAKEWILGTIPTDEDIISAEKHLQKLEDDLIEEKTENAQLSSRRQNLIEEWEKTVEAFNILKKALRPSKL